MDTTNPYLPPEFQNKAFRTQLTVSNDRCSMWSALLPTIICTGISGGVFGIWAGPIGFAFGSMIALSVGCVVSTVVITVAAFIVRDSVTSGLVVAVSATCGAATGFLSAAALFGPWGGLFAAVIGGIGGAVGGVLARIWHGPESDFW